MENTISPRGREIPRSGFNSPVSQTYPIRAYTTPDKPPNQMPLNNDWPQPLISADTRVIVNSLPVPRRFSTGPPRYHHHSRLNKICSREKCSNAGLNQRQISTY